MEQTCERAVQQPRRKMMVAAVEMEMNGSIGSEVWRECSHNFLTQRMWELRREGDSAENVGVEKRRRFC
jgi:hypothetical protein